MFISTAFIFGVINPNVPNNKSFFTKFSTFGSAIIEKIFPTNVKLFACSAL